MNHLRATPSLRNPYFVFRHGYSKANAEGIIVSQPANGIDAYGLSDLGRKQVVDSLGTPSGLRNYMPSLCV